MDEKNDDVLFSTWVEFFRAMKDIYVDYIVDDNYKGQYQKYYKLIIDTKSIINIDIFEYLLANGQDAIEGLNTFIYNDNLDTSLLYNFYIRVLYNTLSIQQFMDYSEIVDNNKHLQNILDKIFKLFLDAGSILNTNFILENLPNINNSDLYNGNNDVIIRHDIINCEKLGLLIDILSNNHYIIDLDILSSDISDIAFVSQIPNYGVLPHNLSNIPAISYDDENTDHLYENKMCSYVVLSNLKFYSQYIQYKSGMLGVIGSNVIFHNWDDFFYMFNYIKNGSENDYHNFINCTNEFTNGFYTTIKYILQDGYNKYIIKNDKDEFINFAQEGLDKYIFHISKYNKDIFLSPNQFIFSQVELFNNYKNVIALFKEYTIVPNISPIFSLINTDYTDDMIIKPKDLEADIDYIEDLTLDDDSTLYYIRGILLDSIADVYMGESIDWEKINKKKSVKNGVNNITSLLGMIGDYYRYDMVKDVKKYADWNNIKAIELPLHFIDPNNLQNIPYKILRFMRLKFYCNFLQNL